MSNFPVYRININGGDATSEQLLIKKDPYAQSKWVVHVAKTSPSATTFSDIQKLLDRLVDSFKTPNVTKPTTVTKFEPGALTNILSWKSM